MILCLYICGNTETNPLPIEIPRDKGIKTKEERERGKERQYSKLFTSKTNGTKCFTAVRYEFL